MTEDELWEAWLNAYPEHREIENSLSPERRMEFRSKVEGTILYSSYRFNHFLRGLADGALNRLMHAADALSKWVRSLSDK